MSLQCPVSPVYKTSAQQKLQSRNAARIYRFGTPKLRDLLREKCRQRVREARQCSYEKSRNLNAASGDVNDGSPAAASSVAIGEILRQELRELEKDINLQEQIYKELLGEVNEWFAEQLEEEETYLINVGENDDLTCPVCQRAMLVGGGGDGGQSFKCSCEACFNFAGDTEQLRLALRTKIELHEQQCRAPLVFFVEPQSANFRNALNAMCETCDYFCSL